MDFRVIILFIMAGLFVTLEAIIYLNAQNKTIKRAYSIFVINMALWSFGLAMFYKSSTAKAALFWTDVLYFAGSLIPAGFLLFSFVFPSGKINISLLKRSLIFLPNIIIFALFFFTSFMVKEVIITNGAKRLVYGPGHIIWDIQFIAIFAIAFIRFIKSYNNYGGTTKMRLKYIVLGTLAGVMLAGITNVILPWFNRFGLLWLGPPLTLVWLISMVYAIVKYRIMDITIVLTRTTIFIAVYTLVLGLPFAIAVCAKGWLIVTLGPGWWMLPLVLMAALATVGPFIYIYLERKAEGKLLREQKRYQDVLKQASLGITRIRNLQKLLDLIAHIVIKTVRISYVGIYLYNEANDEYVLQVSRDKGRKSIPGLPSDNSLIAWVALKREPLVYEEVKRRMQDSDEPDYKHLEKNMRLLTASVIIPCFLEDRFIGFIVLGDKLSGQIYTPEDLNVFQVLASQAALAIENAQFYEEAKEMQAQIAQAEKMATIGTMADGLSHQINNRFYALSLITGDTIDTIKMTDTSKCTPEIKDMLRQINHALTRIQTNVMQGGEVVRGILKYTRKGEESFEPLTLDQIVDGTLEMVQYKVKLTELNIIRDYPKDTPTIKGNLTQLEEAFFNFIDNAYDAIVERRALLAENGYQGQIIIKAEAKDNILEIAIEDNGIGIKNEDLKRIFTPFFTTKTSSRKGTGLGLYVVRRIISDMHKGKISFESKYKSGTRFIIELPIAK